ncbi:MAG: right-handed parallel beta-helix repeat-containing protein [Sedimentisphaerales bacterium]|nr:right-handed parallel beta-helix repeat-containing protein [Sedimentisphaerales bacterium]
MSGKGYYIDSVNGDDTSTGTTSHEPWKSLKKTAERVFHPGDRILLKAGTVYEGSLHPQGSGKPQAPIVISSYGEGPLPQVHAMGRHKEALLLENQEYWEVSNLELTNKGASPMPRRCGVRVSISDFGTAHHIHLNGLYVHDVNGSNIKADGAGYGILWENFGKKPSRFDDLLIENCTLERTDRNGICGLSDFYQRSVWFPSTNVVIRNNRLSDIGGDGIVPIGTDGCVIEHNRLHGGRMRCGPDDYAAGIWPWSCDNTIIQFNEVSGMHGTQDGQAFDSDDNCISTLFQYNFSHDNEGGFMLVCSCGDAEPGSAWLENTVIRYNISQNDRTRLFHIGGPAKNTFVYNNTFYVGPGINLHAVLETEDNGWPQNTRFCNNIFCVEGEADFRFGRSTANVFENNVFYGSFRNMPEGSSSITSNPLLSAPGRAVDYEDLVGYMLQEDSICRGAGRAVKANGGRDFWGNRVIESKPPDIGAHQRTLH